MAIKIGNASAFWGDDPSAPEKLLAQVPDLDYLTLDYLSEVSLSIMAIQREKNPQDGFARDFVQVISSLIPFWNKSSKVKVVTNAGGLNPLACAQACAEILKNGQCNRRILIGVVAGDDVLPHLLNAAPGTFDNLDSGQPLSMIKNQLVTANAYLGAMGITDALNSNADIVITGRVADPSLTVGPCMHHFKWSWDDYDKIANATVAGHLIECGTQATGGISTDWLNLSDSLNIGFPVAEIYPDGICILTKGKDTGGKVTLDIVKEQLLYEIGDPANYLSPDVKVSFLNISLEDCGDNRVRIIGAEGKPPPYTYKVSATYQAGYKAEAYLTIFGSQAAIKAKRCAEVIKNKLRKEELLPEKFHAEFLGTGACVPGISTINEADLVECVLRMSVLDKNKKPAEYFSSLVASLVTCGAPGVTGYTSGRPHVRPTFGYWPCLIDADRLQTSLTLLEVPRCS